jgi:hypothetical protein
MVVSSLGSGWVGVVKSLADEGGAGLWVTEVGVGE